MLYEIMNCADASEATCEAEAPTTAIISITDYGDEKNTFCRREWVKGILELQFNDEEAGGHRCITPQQAEEIADFVLRVHKQVERIIVHCEFGQSRSAGVTAAIRMFFEGNDGGIFKNPDYSPNRTCYRYVLGALRKKSKTDATEME